MCSRSLSCRPSAPAWALNSRTYGNPWTRLIASNGSADISRRSSSPSKTGGTDDFVAAAAAAPRAARTFDFHKLQRRPNTLNSYWDGQHPRWTADSNKHRTRSRNRGGEKQGRPQNRQGQKKKMVKKNQPGGGKGKED